MGVFDEAAAEFIGQARGRSPRHEGASYDPERVAEAARNWKRCEPARKKAERSIETGGPLAAEDAVRKQKYVDRLMKKAGVVAAAGREEVPQGVKEAIEASASGRLKVGTMPDKMLERVIGAAEEFLSVTFVARAAFVLRSVGRIIDRHDKKGFGTGFLVAPGVLMTNEHVLGSAGEADSALVQFQYELDMSLRELPGHEFRLEPKRLFRIDRDLDFALVAVADRSEQDARPLTDFGYLPLAGVEGKIHVGQPVNIIQHPDGGRKQIVFRESVLKLLPKNVDTVAHYTGDTKPGSSGSPVFSDSWEVIALHHSGVPDMRRARPLARSQRGSVGRAGPRGRQVDRQRGHPGLAARQADRGAARPGDRLGARAARLGPRGRPPGCRRGPLFAPTPRPPSASWRREADRPPDPVPQPAPAAPAGSVSFQNSAQRHRLARAADARLSRRGQKISGSRRKTSAVSAPFRPMAMPAKVPASSLTWKARAVPMPWLATPTAKPRAA